MSEGKSVVAQIDEQSGEQSKLRAVGALRRTGVDDPEGIVEYLGQFDATRDLAANQESFTNEIKRIRQNVDLSDSERLQAGRSAAEQARQRHEELAVELSRQTTRRAEKLDKTLYHTSDTTTLNQLADLDRNQLDARAEIARGSGNTEMLRAVRSVARTKGFDDVVAKTVGMDPSEDVAGAFLEGQKLRSAGALDAIVSTYQPPPVKAEQLQPSSADIEEHARYVKDSQERSADRIMQGKPGLTDRDFTPRPRRQVGRDKSRPS